MPLGISTREYFTVSEARQALTRVPQPTYGTREDNIFYFEMLPLVQIAEYLLSKNHPVNRIRFSDDGNDQNRSDDGIIVLTTFEQRIQFTQAWINDRDRHQETIRMEHMDIYGRAPGVQDMEWSGSRRDRDLPEQNTRAFYYQDLLKKLRCRIENGIQGKLDPKYEGNWLGVVFEGYFLSWSDETKRDVGIICDELVHQHLCELKAIFRKIFFIERKEKFILHFDLTE